MIKAEVEKDRDNPLSGPSYKITVGGMDYPLNPSDTDLRKLEPGSTIQVFTERGGRITIFDPPPQIGCETN